MASSDKGRPDFKTSLKVLATKYHTLLAGFLFIMGIAIRVFSASQVGPLWPIVGEMGTFLAAIIAIPFIYDKFIKTEDRKLFLSDLDELLDSKLTGKDDILPASRFFQKYKLHQLPDTIFASAQSIDIMGIVLGRTTREFMSILQERVRAGTHLRMIICDPTDKEVVNQIALREFGSFPPAYMKERLEGVEAYVKEIAKIPHKRGAIQIGFLPFVPSFGQISIDASKPQAKCYVEMYHHKAADSNPVFEVYRSNDSSWHDFFVQQYALLWSCCRQEIL